MRPPRLDGRAAIVTGAGRGIGRAIARVFAREGAAILVVDRDEEAAERAAQEVLDAGGSASACRADITSKADIDGAVRTALARWGRIDLLAQNAGIYPSVTIDAMTEADWDHVQAVNVRSLFLLVQACLPAMKAQRYGRITVTSSITGPRVGYPGLTHYAASKAAINGFIRSAALELAPHGITINGVEPGTVLTEGIREMLEPDNITELASTIPAKRLADPDDIAYAHLFLASDEASYVTGQTLVVDGGQILPETPFAVL